jgi:hypothetical protein
LNRQDILLKNILMQLRHAPASLLSIWLLACAPTFARSNSQTVQAFKLAQSHVTLGPIDVFYTNDAVKMVLKNNGTILLARAPSWKVSVFRPAAKVAYEQSLQSFEKNGLRCVVVPYIPDVTFHRQSVEHVNGETIVESSETTDKDSKYDYWMIEPVAIPMQACEILEKAVRVPYRHAIPIKLLGDEPGHDDFRSKDKIAWHLGGRERMAGGRTTSVRIQTFTWSKVNLPRSEFDYPVGYKAVQSEPEVFMTDRAKMMVEDLLGGPPDAKSAPK